jgi:hypothetical protein
MTPPLTRETLAELRRLREAAGVTATALMAAVAAKDFAAMTRLRRLLHRQRHDARAALLLHSEALLTAAERGLDVEDGR